ncbi:DNA topoisomerase I [Candidatus Woesearchaeota archaeon]|nr:DNA topoisomerase I [Candidatus Woesearchaeota archaeon]
MSYELIITEKPQAAKKLADALSDGMPVKENISRVPYYKLTHSGRDIVIGCAVGHLFTVAEKKPAVKSGAKGKKTGNGWTYPVFDVEWVQSSKTSKASAFTSRYVNALKSLSKDADIFTVACDYDIEGEVIGYNVIKHICKRDDAKRMKFSTLTKAELQRSYENASKNIDWGQAKAGLTRHELDWYYGINLSRALTIAVKNAGSFKILSSGRVQGPALKILVEKEKEIQAFKPVPFWQIELNGIADGQQIAAWHKEDKFWDKDKADSVMENTKGHDGRISDIEKKQFNQSPPFPFDLTTLQTEAYRSLRIQPKKTLELAQELYIAGLISYPRTSSQQLPPEIGYKGIIQNISKQGFYKPYAEKLLLRDALKPNNGPKTDPAHPAIYPTGQITAISGDKARIYDLVVRRFLAAFGDPSLRETVTITIDVNSERFLAKGTRTIEKGWHEFYGSHVMMEEQEMPGVEKGNTVNVEKIILHAKETQPPKRYTPASIIRELEKRNLGTKATRAAIVDALFDRGYVNGLSVEATPLGIRTVDILSKYSPEIIDEELTKYFEEEMEKIREDKATPEQVLSEARAKLTDILDKFRKNELDIGKEMIKAISETRDEMNYIGKCSKCGGNLSITKGKFGYFVACDNYPKCKNTFNLPNNCLVKGTQEVCKHCGSPVVIVIRKGKRPQKLCINNDCPSKKNSNAEVKQETDEMANGVVEKECPKCGNPLVLRKSIYGTFLGCSKFPKCKYTERIPDGPVKEDFTEGKTK